MGHGMLMVSGHFVALIEFGMRRIECNPGHKLDGFGKLLLLVEYHDITFLLVLEFASHKWKLQFGLSAVADFFQLGEIRLSPVLIK